MRARPAEPADRDRLDRVAGRAAPHADAEPAFTVDAAADDRAGTELRDRAERRRRHGWRWRRRSARERLVRERRRRARGEGLVEERADPQREQATDRGGVGTVELADLDGGAAVALTDDDHGVCAVGLRR